MMDETPKSGGVTAASGNSVSERLMGRFGSRAEAETIVQRLTAIGVSPNGISVSEARNGIAKKAKAHVGEGLVLGLAVGGLLGALSGAIFIGPSATLNLAGQNFTGTTAGAMYGLGYGLVLGVVLGIVVGLISKATASSPISGFDELATGAAVVEVQVPATLAPRVRDILNA